MRRIGITLLALATAIILAGVALVIRHGFPVALMDLDGDGRVSPAEYLQSLEHWHRPAGGRDAGCTEIFRLKDGLPVQVVCTPG